MSTLTRPFPKDLLERALGVARELAAPQGVGLRLFTDNSGTIFKYNDEKERIFSWNRPAELEQAVIEQERLIEARKNPMRVYWMQEESDKTRERWLFRPPVLGVRAIVWRSGSRFQAMVNGTLIRDTFLTLETAKDAAESTLIYGANYILRIQKGEFLNE